VAEGDQSREAATADLIGGIIRAAILLVMEFIVLSLLIPAEWAERVQASETTALQDQLGTGTAAAIGLTASDWYKTLLVEPGVVAQSYRMVTLSPADIVQAQDTGLGSLTKAAFWNWMGERMDILWWMIRNAFQRLVLLLAWWPYLLVVVAFAAGDGWMRRRIRQSSFAYASPLRHHYAVRGMVWLGLAGLFGLFLPIPWSPWLIPLAGAIVAALVGLALANTQKRV
jgi:hypothetical protein